MAATDLGAKEVAAELGTDARTCRKFLRDITDPEDHPGQGGRWAIPRKQLKKLRDQFEEWGAKPAPSADEDLDLDEEVVDDDELDEITESDSLDLEDIDDPTDDDLDDLEDDEDIEEIG